MKIIERTILTTSSQNHDVDKLAVMGNAYMYIIYFLAWLDMYRVQERSCEKLQGRNLVSVPASKYQRQLMPTISIPVSYIFNSLYWTNLANIL